MKGKGVRVIFSVGMLRLIGHFDRKMTLTPFPEGA